MFEILEKVAKELLEQGAEHLLKHYASQPSNTRKMKRAALELGYDVVFLWLFKFLKVAQPELWDEKYATKQRIYARRILDELLILDLRIDYIPEQFRSFKKAQRFFNKHHSSIESQLLIRNKEFSRLYIYGFKLGQIIVSLNMRIVHQKKIGKERAIVER